MKHAFWFIIGAAVILLGATEHGTARLVDVSGGVIVIATSAIVEARRRIKN